MQLGVSLDAITKSVHGKFSCILLTLIGRKHKSRGQFHKVLFKDYHRRLGAFGVGKTYAAPYFVATLIYY